MNIDRLQQLADTVEAGVIRFDDKGLVVLFNMAYGFLKLSKTYPYSGYQVPKRVDTVDKLGDANCVACLAGLTVLMFGDIPVKEMNDEYVDLYIEASILLGL